MTDERLKKLQTKLINAAIVYEINLTEEDYDDLVDLAFYEQQRRVKSAQHRTAPSEEVERLIEKHQGKINCYPRWIAEINDQHISKKEKQYQISFQERQRDDDIIILSALRQMQGWIPVNEPPESERVVIVASNKTVTTGYYYSGEWYNVHGGRIGATEWMELPSAPSDDKERRTPCE